MNYLLFTTSNCSKCPAFKEFVKKHVHCDGKIIDQNDPEFFALSLEFTVSSVPTLIIFEDASQEGSLLRTNDVVDVYDFVNAHP